jgi:hypothetical protein
MQDLTPLKELSKGEDNMWQLRTICAPRYEKLFGHLKATVALLKQHGVTVADSLLQRIEEGPDHWQELMTTWSNVQDNFVHELEILRDQFNHEAFFVWEVGYSRATELIQKWDRILEKQDDEAAKIQANGELFEFTVNPFKNLGPMKADLTLLESVWETVHKIETELQAWKNIL